MQRSLILIAVVLIFGVGCGGLADRPSPDALPPVVAETGRVEYRCVTTLAECPDAPARVDRRLRELEAILHVNGPAKIVYSNFRNYGESTAACNDIGGQCAFGNQILATDWAMYHEIVHATVGGWPNSILREGLADALGYTGDKTGKDPWPAWNDFFSTDPSVAKSVSGGEYYYGAAFVTYLITNYGVDKLIALYRASQFGESAAEFAQRFGAIYVVSLDEAWAEATATALSTSVCTGLVPNMAVDGSEAVVPGDHCINSQIYGRHAFVLDQDTPLGVETGYGELTFGACNVNVMAPLTWTGAWITNSESAGAHTLHLAAWQKGMYYATVFVNKDDETLKIRSGNWMAGSCDQVAPYQLSQPVREIQLLMRGGADSWAAIQWTGDAPLEFQYVQMTQTASRYEWSLCSSCDELSCVPVNISPPWTSLTLSSSQVLWIHAVRPDGNSTEVDLLTFDQ